MKRGKKPTTGVFSTRKELEEEVVRLRKKRYSFGWIGRYCKVNPKIVARICREEELKWKVKNHIVSS